MGDLLVYRLIFSLLRHDDARMSRGCHVSFCAFSLLWRAILVALPVALLEQFSEVFVLPAGRFKIENLVLDAYPQVVQ